MRHQYTRAELESITQETAIYIEGTGIAQLQWGGLEIACLLYTSPSPRDTR